MPPKFPPRDPLGPDKVVYHCSICRRALWPSEDAAERLGFTDDLVDENVAIIMPRPNTTVTSPLRRWDGFVFCPEHAAERGIT